MRIVRSATGHRLVFLGVLLILGAWAVAALAIGPDKSLRPEERLAQLPAAGKAAAPAAQPEKKITFEMRDKPWIGSQGAVLEWLADQAGMPVSTSSAKPTGTLTFISPRENDKPKQYTLPEVIDILNDELLKQNLILIRRKKTFTIEAADKPVDPAALPQILPDELDHYGNTELVSVIFPLVSLVADDFAAEVKPMLGPFGKVDPLGKPNKLVVQDTVATLKRLRGIIKDTEDSEQQQGKSYSHKCVYIRARDAENILRTLLGDPRELLSLMNPQAFSRGRGNFPNPLGGQFGGQFGGPAFDGGRPQPTQQAALPKIRMHYISVDEANNMVIVTGPADKTSQAKEIMEKIDRPVSKDQKPVLTGPPILRTYTVPGGNADAVAKNLQDAYKTPTVRISAVNPNAIMVWAGPGDQLDIVEQIRGAKEQIGLFEVITLTNLDPTDTVEILKDMFGSDTKTGAAYLKADLTKNAIVVRGTSDQVEDIKTALKALGEGRGPASGSTLRIIPIEQGSTAAATIAEALQRMLPQIMPNPVQVITPGGGENRNQEQPKSAPPKKSAGNNELGSNEEQEAPAHGQAQGFVDPQQQPAQKNNQPANQSAPLKITVVGNRIIITSDDPKALDTAQQLVRLMTAPAGGQGDYEAIRLKNVSAVDVAKALDEAFNGPKQTTTTPQFGQTGFGGGGGRGGRGGLASLFGQFGAPGATTPTTPSPNTIRVVAFAPNNTILVRANPLDMLRIKQLLKNAIDTDDTDSKAVLKTWYLGPLKFASAQEVASVIRDVYREYTNNNPTQTSVQGIGGFGFFRGGRGGQQNQNLDANGNPRGVTLSVAVDDHANRLIVHCSEVLYKDIEALVTELDSSTGTRKVKVIPLQGVDPLIVQQAIDAIQGRRPSTTPTFGGGFGQSPFGGGRGGMPGYTPGQSGGGGRGGGGGRTSGQGPQSRGPDFFASRVKDDPQPSLFFDPQHAPTDGVQHSENSTAATFQQIKYEEQQPPASPSAPDVRGPRGTVTADALEQLGAIVISGSQADIEAVAQIIELIRTLGAGAEVQIQLVPLEHADATSVTSILTQLFQRVIVGPGGNITSTAPTTTARPPTTSQFGQPAAAQAQAGSAVLFPLPRLNAILMAAPRARVEDILKEIKRLDLASNTQGRPTAFALKKASAARVATLLTNFYSQRYPNETAVQNQIRFTYEDSTNTVFVQAAPGDLAEIRELIERVDNTVSSAVNDLRIIPLHFALASDMATLIVQSISQGIVAPTAGTPTALPTTGPGGLPGAPGLPRTPALPGTPGAPTALPTGVPTAQTTGTTKTISLRFFSPRPNGPGPVEAGILEDIHITPDVRTNSLVIAAQSTTMELLHALIRELDVPPPGRAVVKVFPLRRADAANMATLLQQLFFGTGTTAAPAAAGGPGTTTAGSTVGPVVAGVPTVPFSVGGTPEAALVELRITTDVRTNSLIVAAAQNDMDVVEAIIRRLEEGDFQARHNTVVHLRYASAPDVASALQGFLNNELTVITKAGLYTPYQERLQDVVVYAEPITNRLLVSASPNYFPEVMRLIDELDVSAPQVVIQVLVAEVDLTSTEEFGVEIGLQSPVLFTRSIIPADGLLGTGTINYSNATGGLIPPGVTVNSSINPTAQPGFNFNDVSVPLGNNPAVSRGVVGFQGLGNLGVNRVSPTGVGGFVFSAASNTFNLLIRALKTQGRIDILSRPQIQTTDNQTALVNIGQDVPYVTGTAITATGLITNTISYRSVGVIMQVTPRISPDGTVLMRVIPEVSSVAPTQISLGNGQTATQFNVQHFETTVSARDGETVAIGGMIQKRDTKAENKYPWLGDLPYVGSLFRYRTQSRGKTELLVILTPHVIRCPRDRERILAEEARRMDWIVGDVVKTQGNSGMAPILVPPPPTGAGVGVDPLATSPLSGIPDGSRLLPGPTANETLPPPQVVPQSKPSAQPQTPSAAKPMSQNSAPSGAPPTMPAEQSAASASPPEPPKERQGWSFFSWWRK